MINVTKCVEVDEYMRKRVNYSLDKCTKTKLIDLSNPLTVRQDILYFNILIHLPYIKYNDLLKKMLETVKLDYSAGISYI